jgi:hypothetical protein
MPKHDNTLPGLDGANPPIPAEWPNFAVGRRLIPGAALRQARRPANIAAPGRHSR